MSRRTAQRHKPAPAPKLDADAELARALALHQAGRLAEAEPIYRRVLAEERDNAQANQLLGVACLQRGDSNAAVELLARAVELSPDNPQYLCDLGVAQNAANLFEEAIRSLNAAIDLKPDYAQAHSNLGMALKNLRRVEAAIASFREAIRLRPDEPGFRHNLGNALTALGDLHEAESAYREALRLRPGYPAALSGLAMTLAELGRAEEAVAVGLDAVRKRYNVAAYHTALGKSYRAARQPEQAVASFRRTLELDPNDMEAVRYIALLQRKEALDSEMRQLVDLLDSRKLQTEQQVNLAYALATWFDDLKEYERASGYYSRANEIKRRQGPFSLAKARADVESISNLFDRMPARTLGPNSADWAPIFVVGLPRAGKTTLEGMLARHPNVRSAGELRILSLLGAELSVKHGLAKPGAHISNVPEADLREVAEKYQRHARSIVPSPYVPVDTMPPNYRLIGLIAMTMPSARVINCIRDPVEHCVEIYKKCFGSGYEYSCDLNDTAAYYRLYEDMMDFWRSTLPGFVLDVDVANFASDAESQVRRLLDFCGLEFDERCASFFESEPRLGETGSSSPGERQASLAPYRPVIEAALAR